MKLWLVFERITCSDWAQGDADKIYDTVKIATARTDDTSNLN